MESQHSAREWLAALFREACDQRHMLTQRFAHPRLVYLALRVHVQKKQLIRESYTDADSGLLTREGFFYFMKRAKQMQGDKEVSVLYIQLYNF